MFFDDLIQVSQGFSKLGVKMVLYTIISSKIFGDFTFLENKWQLGPIYYQSGYAESTDKFIPLESIQLASKGRETAYIFDK